MAKKLTVRRFDGTLTQAEGVIRVTRETFDGCPYTPEALVALESDPDQYLWVAEREGAVVGFVSAFPTDSLDGGRWEVDLLAVLAAEQGQGTGTALVARAVEHGCSHLAGWQSRALVARDNAVSRRVFAKNGFDSQRCVDLLLYEVSGRQPRPQGAGRPAVRAAQLTDAPELTRLSGCAPARVVSLLDRGQNAYLLAEREGQVVGCEELIPVSTLQYRGLWLESLVTAESDQESAGALVGAAIEWSKADAELDEVGCLVSPDDTVAYVACVSEGFKKIGEYDTWIRELDYA